MFTVMPASLIIPEVESNIGTCKLCYIHAEQIEMADHFTFDYFPNIVHESNLLDIIVE